MELEEVYLPQIDHTLTRQNILLEENNELSREIISVVEFRK